MKRDMVIGLVVLMLLAGIALAFALSVTSTEDVRKLYYDNIDRSDSTGMLMKNAQPYQIDDAGSDTYYYRWNGGSGNVLLMRIKKTGNVWAYEKSTNTWANRASATYSPVNQ